MARQGPQQANQEGPSAQVDRGASRWSEPGSIQGHTPGRVSLAKTLQAVLDGKSADEIQEVAREGVSDFERRRLSFLLYE